ncbi:Bifunctional polymyxin resistance protein ArnA [Bienertia sinuspersici]
MQDYIGFKLKRKDLEEVNDDFSDFSLSSPARKIRRLDAELPPIIEEEEADLHLGHDQAMLESTFSNGSAGRAKSVVIEELPSVPENNEKAIVLFNPVNNALVHSEGNFSVDPKLINCFKNQAFWNTYINPGRSKEDEAMENEYNSDENKCKAVIPWVPSQTINSVPVIPVSQPEVSESMDAEEMEGAMMEVEDLDAGNVGIEQMNGNSSFSRLNEGLQLQWQQQHHCMIPQPLQNTATPIVWYR